MNIIETYQLSHADRNLIEEILSANQSNLSTPGIALRKQLDRSIGVSMATYPVDLHANQAAWLRGQIASFEAHSDDALLKFLAKDTLPMLKKKLKVVDSTGFTAIQGRYNTTDYINTSTWLDKGIFSKAFTSAVCVTVAVCVAFWIIIEALSYFTAN